MNETGPADTTPATDAAAAETFPAMVARAQEMLEAGGPVVLILLVLSVFALAIVALKLIQFRRARLGDRKTARNALALYRAGDADGALTLASSSPTKTATTCSSIPSRPIRRVQ